MLFNTKSFPEVLKDFIREQTKQMKGLDYYVVTGVDTTNHRVNIKRLNDTLSYDNVQYVGLNLGNAKGQVKLPDVNDIVIVGFIMDSEIPVVLGTVYDDFSTEKDNKIQIKSNEYLITNKTNGAYIKINSDDEIVLKNGNGSLKLNSDGSVSVNHLETGDAGYTLPATDGSSGQVLKTDGAGVVSWANDETA